MTTALAPAEPDTRRPPDNPLAMLSAALQSGQDPAKLEKLMDLAERWKTDRAAEQFNVALNECQRVMPVVVRDKANGHTSSRYASLESVQAAIRPVYSERGFSLSYGTADSHLPGHYRVVCDVAHVGGCSRRYHLDMPADSAGAKGSSNKTGVQGVGSTISYARRYLALMIFNVTVADEDRDGNAAAELDAITDAEALQIEDELDRKKVNRDKFLEWAREAGLLVLDRLEVRAITRRGLPEVIRVLKAKCDREHGGNPCTDNLCHLKKKGGGS